MKINKSVEQGIYVMLMLALQKDHRPLKSQIMSQRLAVSDSYLKKILRKLVVAGLIDSNASKDGGFTLHRSIEAVSLYDVCQAVEALGTLQLPNLKLADQLFPGSVEHIDQSTQRVTKAFEQAQSAMNTALQATQLSDLLEPGSYQTGIIDWQR